MRCNCLTKKKEKKGWNWKAGMRITNTWFLIKRALKKCNNSPAYLHLNSLVFSNYYHVFSLLFVFTPCLAVSVSIDFDHVTP